MDFTLHNGQTELDFFRVLYCGWLSAAMACQLGRHRRFLRQQVPNERGTVLLLGLWRLPRLGPARSLWLGSFLSVSLALAACGWILPTTLLVAGLAALLYFPQVVDIPEIRRKANTVPVVLFLLGAVYLADPNASGRIASAALLTIKILIAQIYLSAGLMKIRSSSSRWTDGQTLRAFLVKYHLRDDSRPALALASSSRACRAAAIFVLAFELTFWVMIPFPALAMVYLPLGLFFHAATAILMGIHYWIYIAPAYVVFVAHWLV